MTDDVTDEMGDRVPADAYGDGAWSWRFYRPWPSVTGRPLVMVHRGDRARATVGAGTAIGPGVTLMVGGNHRIDWVPTYSIREILDLPGAYEGNPWSKGDVTIGPDVTLGRGVTVLSGVTVGAGAVIRPYAVVTRDIAPYAIAEGSPCREVGWRFDPAAIERLLRVAWWDAEGPARHEGRRWRSMQAGRVRRFAAQTLLRVARRLDAPAPGPGDGVVPTAGEVLPPLDPAVTTMGHRSYFNPIVHHDGSGRHHLTIGPYCSIAFDAEFVLDDSASPSSRSAVALGLDPSSDRAAGRSGGDITVGADCWITRGAKLLPGITIGPGAVVSAYAVVTGDVRPYAVVAGNPAREVGRRFDDDVVDALLDIRWWDWPEEEIAAAAPLLCADDARAFVAAHRRR